MARCFVLQFDRTPRSLHVAGLFWEDLLGMRCSTCVAPVYVAIRVLDASISQNDGFGWANCRGSTRHLRAKFQQPIYTYGIPHYVLIIMVFNHAHVARIASKISPWGYKHTG